MITLAFIAEDVAGYGMPKRPTLEQVSAVRRKLPRGAGSYRDVNMREAAHAAGVNAEAWRAWESRATGPFTWHVLRLLCIDQGLIAAEDDFGAWLDTLLGEAEAA